MADELKPCPFCGVSSWEFRIVDTEDREGTPCAYTCGECGASGPWMYLRKSGDENNSFDDARLIRRLNGRPIEDALRAEVERLKVAEGEAMLVVESQDVSIANLRAEVAVLREQRDHKFEQFLDWRGIEVGEQCDRCQGAGSYMYSSTATWMGGIGGQAMTVGVCDKCWGSGKKNKPWTNLRAVMSMRDEIAALKARLAKYTEPLTEEQARSVRLGEYRATMNEWDRDKPALELAWDAAIRAAKEGAI